MKFEITSPDGRKFEITAPEGATQEQVLAYAKQQFGQRRQSAQEQIAADPITKGAQRIAGTSLADLISANPMVRVMTSAARPILAANNLIARPLGFQGADLKSLDEMQQRGAEALGFDATDTIAQDVAGGLIGPISGVAMKTPYAAGAGARIVQGAQIGGLAGVTSGSDTPLEDAALGATVGAAIPTAIESGKGVARGLSHVADLFRGEKGAENIFNRYITKVVGRENIPVVAKQMRKGGAEPLPEYKPTTAESVAGLPEGSPIIAHQKVTARTPGGPSAQFGHRISEQEKAITAAYKARDEQVVPALKTTLKTATDNGISSKNITNQIDDLLSEPGYRSSDVVNKSLTAIKEKLNKFTENGIINGEDLWTIRKEIGNTIKTFSKETSNWDKRLTSKLEGQVQKAIDSSIVDAGGKDWPRYMAEYSKRTKTIEGVKEALKGSIRPDQSTDLFGGLRIAEETRAHVPQLLSRPMMAANAIMRYFSANIEPKIDKLATRRYLNPTEFAAALEKLPPPTQHKITEMMKRVGIANVVLQGEKEKNQQ